MKDHELMIVAAKRTPQGAMLGQLSSLKAQELGAFAHQGAMKQAHLAPEDINEVMTGCALQAGLGQAPARQAAILSGIPYAAGATTINKLCGSGMKSVMLAHDLIAAGSAQIVLAGGMESMSNAPYVLSKARAGYRLGHGELKDSLFLDGLEDAYEQGRLMGSFAEDTARHFHFTRAAQDAYAIRSMTRALQAQREGAFDDEIVKITLKDKSGEHIISKDEAPNADKLAKIPQLRPAFLADGSITAGNSSSISDGAASLILMTRASAKQRGITPLARIVAHSSHAQEPKWFTTAPVEAIRKVLKKAEWSIRDVDLFEINEAFAVVAMVALSELHLDPERVNIHGGACALGHPIGASGARILVTLIHALKRINKHRGVASLCIGGGEATAMALEVF